MMGMMPNLFAYRPHAAEHDFSGVIVDANDSAFRNGQDVYGWMPVCKHTTEPRLMFGADERHDVLADRKSVV